MQNGIVVIADDFTGAAELAGIGLRYGLRLHLCLSLEAFSKLKHNEGAIISTDSRSMSEPAALAITKQFLHEAIKTKPVLLYKKIDSVLRGYVIAELKIQMQVLGLSKAIIVPANPSLGRTITNGKYFIDSVEITETDFINDPEFPIKSSLVKNILNEPSLEFCKATNHLPTKGMMVAEVSSTADLNEWATKIDSNFALIGAGDFFIAILEKKFAKQQQSAPTMNGTFLYVVGSAFETVKKRVATWKLQARSIKHLHLYFDLVEMRDNIFLLTIQNGANSKSALELREAMALLVQELMVELKITELFVEGGSTAAATLKQLKIEQLQPVNEWSRGVVRMKFQDFYITVKPGSYPLPPVIADLLQNDVTSN